MNSIFVEPTQLADKSGEIRVLKNDLVKTMEEIEWLILSVNGSWQGDAEKAFAAQLLYVKKHFTDIAVFFDEYADLIKNFAYSYEQMESDLATKINLT